MKTLFTLLLFSMSAISTSAQNTEKEEYLIARPRGSGSNFVLFIDYSNYTVKENFPMGEAVNDSLGKTMKFESESAALNYIAKKSWVMVSVVPVLSQGTSIETKYIFKRKIIAESLPTAKPTAE